MSTLSKTIVKFTERESQILDLVAKGYTNHQIAGELFLCESTVECYRRKMCKRAGTKYILAPAVQIVNGFPVNMQNMESVITTKENNRNTLKVPSYLKVIKGGLFPPNPGTYTSVGKNPYRINK